MLRRFRGYSLPVISLFLVFFIASCSGPSDSKGYPNGALATVHPLATEAGLAAIEQGGNAIDAAIAAAFALGVVDGHNSGIGGGCFIVMRRADGQVMVLDGRETAPKKAHRDMYLRRGTVQPKLSKTGALAVATPSALAAYERALELGGNLSLAEVIRPSISYAEEGFPLNQNYASRILRKEEDLRADPGCLEIFFRDGVPLKEGQLLVQSDLANTYRSIAELGSDWFYTGRFAEQVDAWMQENGGVLTKEDFAAYHWIERAPLRSKFRDVELVGFPPPSSGGVHVAQILNILENFNPDMEDYDHVIVEAMKLAFADRAYWLGDPAYTNVPQGLIREDYAAAQAAKIDPSRAVEVLTAGMPPQAEVNFFPKHTTHIAAADAEGNWVAITGTINTTFGAKVIVPGTGVLLNNEMDDFFDFSRRAECVWTGRLSCECGRAGKASSLQHEPNHRLPQRRAVHDPWRGRRSYDHHASSRDADLRSGSRQEFARSGCCTAHASPMEARSCVHRRCVG